MATFRGFQSHDFDAYAPAKWQSNVFNLERMQVKDKLLCLGRDVSPLVPGPDSPALAPEPSVEHPAVWNGNKVTEQAVYFLRPESERKELFGRITKARPMSSLLADPSPYREHIHLSVVLNQSELIVGLSLHADAAVDRQNAARKIADSWQLQSLTDYITGLGDEVLVSLHTREPSIPSHLTSEALREALTTEPGPSAPGSPGKVVVGATRRYSRDEPRLGEPAFAQQVRADLSELLPLYAFLAWSHLNDLVSVKEAIKEEKKVRKARGLTRDDRVRVTRGLFTGKTGVIIEVDARGGLRVQLGTMVVKLDAADVAPQS